jgi:tetratricopeptide (TPR) repeat protein
MKDFELCHFLTESEKIEPCIKCPIDTEKASKLDPQGIAEKCLRTLLLQIEELDKFKDEDRHKEFMDLLMILDRVTNLENDYSLDGMHRRIAERALNQLEAIFSDLIEEDNANAANIRFNFGNVYFNLERYQDALKCFEKAVSLGSGHSKLFNNIGVALVRLKRQEEALIYYDKALKSDPEFGNAWFNKGKALYALDRIREALECFRNATKYSSGNKSAWNNLGVTLRHFERFEEAIKSYDEALKIDGNYAWAWHNKGIALAELKRYKEAMICFDRALQIDPRFDPARRDKQDLMRKMI